MSYSLSITNAQGWVRFFDLGTHTFVQIGSSPRQASNIINLPPPLAEDGVLLAYHAQLINQPEGISLVNLSDDPTSLCIQRPPPREDLNLEMGKRVPVHLDDVIKLCGYKLKLLNYSAAVPEPLAAPQVYEGMGSPHIQLSVTLNRGILLPDSEIIITAMVRNLTVKRESILIQIKGLPMQATQEHTKSLTLYPNSKSSEVTLRIKHPDDRAMDQGERKFTIEATRQSEKDDKPAIAPCSIIIAPVYRYRFVSLDAGPKKRRKKIATQAAEPAPAPDSAQTPA